VALAAIYFPGERIGGRLVLGAVAIVAGGILIGIAAAY
jgi:drug/metabolite transporter (DMT)-like permease